MDKNWPLRIGLLLVALSWFFFTGYQFIKGAFNIFGGAFWISLTDTAGTFGLGFRTMAALIAVFTILFFIFKKDLSKPELYMSVRWIILGEIVAFLALFPVVVWGFSFLANPDLSAVGLGNFIETTLPVMIESIGIPIVLAKLFFQLNPNKPTRSIIKWGAITGFVYILVLWINNTGNWIGAISRKGIEYMTAYPDHIFSFGLTSIGLLILTLFTAYYIKKTVKTKTLEEIDLRKAGAIITATGLYFLILYMMWLFLGTDAKWSTWYAWLLGHNMELWMLSLPMVGLPLMYLNKPQSKDIAENQKH